MLILSESNVRQCFDMKSCIRVNRQALIAIATGDAIVPTRLGLSYFNHSNEKNNNTTKTSCKNGTNVAEDWTLFKPASLQEQLQKTMKPSNKQESIDRPSSITSMGMKIVSIRNDNVAKEHPLVPATIICVHPETGIVQAIVAATYLTAVRTAAGSALAVYHYFEKLQQQDVNKKRSPQHVVVFGAGLQAEQHIRAISCMFNDYCIPHVTVINRNIERAQLLMESLARDKIVASYTIEALLVDNMNRIEESILVTGDVIVACTNTTTALWGSSRNSSTYDIWNNKSCIITGIGSYTPYMQEIPTYVVNQCKQVWIDTLDATQVGDLKHLLNKDVNTKLAPKLLGSVLHQEHRLDTDSNYINGLVFYKAVGTAIQDVLTANMIVERAKESGIGTTIDMR